MKASISLEGLWQLIRPMSLSSRKWLLAKLQDNVRREEAEADYISKEEILAGIESGLRDLKAGRKQSFDEFIKEHEQEEAEEETVKQGKKCSKT